MRQLITLVVSFLLVSTARLTLTNEGAEPVWAVSYQLES